MGVAILKNSVQQAKLNHGHGIMNGFPTLVHVYVPDVCFSWFRAHQNAPKGQNTQNGREAIYNSVPMVELLAPMLSFKNS
jgi:hypothetical protein